MEPPVELAKLSTPARRALDPASPAPMRQMAAKGLLPGLKPAEALTVVALLAESDAPAIAAAAQGTLDALPEPLLRGALAGDLPPGVLAVVAPRYAKHAPLMERILAHPAIPVAAVALVAELADEMVSELVAVNERLLLSAPAIIEKLYMNKATRMSTADRILELAVRNGVELPGIPAYKQAAAAIGQELIAEPSLEPTPDDVLFKEVDEAATAAELDPATEDTHKLDAATGEEVVDDKFLPLHARLASMTITQKIRRAMLGTASERLLLVRDTNRLVAEAAIRSPSLQENEVVRISASRNVGEEVLRIIANDREWTRSYQIKLNLVQNPRTPFTFASKLLPHMRDHELKMLAKSKNVPGAVSTAARQQLGRRKVEI